MVSKKSLKKLKSKESTTKKSKNKFFVDKSKIKLHPLSPFWENVEHINSILIPYAVFLLAIIIVVELFFEIHSHLLEQLIHLVDYLIIGVFVVDLCFIYYHVRRWSIFFRRFWLDILAVFPFVLFMRGLGSIFRFFKISDQLFFGQTLLHEGLEVRKAAAAARGQRIAKYLKLGARGIRVLSKSRFFSAFRNAKKRK